MPDIVQPLGEGQDYGDAQVIALLGSASAPVPVAIPTEAALTVVSNAATLTFADRIGYLTATVTASVALTLASPTLGAIKRVALTNSGGSVSAHTFASGPTVKLEGGTFSATASAVNVYRIECISTAGSGVYAYTISQES